MIQHIYDTHFLGVEQVEQYLAVWSSLQDKINEQTYLHILGRLEGQLEDAKEWRDVINSYFYRISRIDDALHRKIY